MSLSGPAKRLTIIIDEDHTWHHKPLCPEIIKRAHAAGLAKRISARGPWMRTPTCRDSISRWKRPSLSWSAAARRSDSRSDGSGSLLSIPPS